MEVFISVLFILAVLTIYYFIGIVALCLIYRLMWGDPRDDYDPDSIMLGICFVAILWPLAVPAIIAVIAISFVATKLFDWFGSGFMRLMFGKRK